jgi:membrane associated rhomboid family serine protease
MLFLATFGKNVEDAFRSLAYLVFYFAAMMTQTAMTLLFGPAQTARVPELGASGAVAAVLGAHFVLYPGPQIFPVLRGVLRPRRRVHLRPAGSTAPCLGGTGSTQGAMALHGAARGILAATGEIRRPLRTCAPTWDRV